jgi:hypothetical protein
MPQIIASSNENNFIVITPTVGGVSGIPSTLSITNTLDAIISLVRTEQGPQGEVGPIGPEGPRGIQGPIGLKGDKGNKGDKGDKGDAGSFSKLLVGSGNIADVTLSDDNAVLKFIGSGINISFNDTNKSIAFVQNISGISGIQVSYIKNSGHLISLSDPTIDVTDITNLAIYISGFVDDHFLQRAINNGIIARYTMPGLQIGNFTIENNTIQSASGSVYMGINNPAQYSRLEFFEINGGTP